MTRRWNAPIANRTKGIPKEQEHGANGQFLCKGFEPEHEAWKSFLPTRIGSTVIRKTFISTVRIGPYYETMIFGGPHDLYKRRCTTPEEALEQHIKASNLVRGRCL